MTPSGVQIAYPSPALLRKLTPSTRRRVRGRAVLALTANPHYALRGVRPGARLAKVAHRLRAGRGLRIGLNSWYLTPAGVSRGLVEVRRGIVQEVGIVDGSLTAGRAAARRLLRSLS